MSIDADNRRVTYFGTGARVAFPFAFKVFAAGDLNVVQTDLTGAETLLTLALEYTVSLNADQDLAPGGEVTLFLPLPAGYELTLISAVPFTQLIKLTNQGGFYPSVINDGFDKLTILIQQIKDGIVHGLPDSNVITVQEKHAMALGWALIQSEYAYLMDSSNTIGVSGTSFSQAFYDLNAFIAPVLLNMNVDSLVSRTLYNDLVQTYYIARAAQTAALLSALQFSGAPVGSLVAGMAAESLVATVNAHSAALSQLGTYASLTPEKKDLLKPLWDSLAKEWEELLALATLHDLDVAGFNAAYAAMYARAFDLFGLSAEDHYAYNNRNVTSSAFDFDGFKAAIVAFKGAAIALQSAINTAITAAQLSSVDAVTLVGREDWEYVQSDVGLIKLGTAYSGAGTTVTLDLSNKPGPSSATNVWMELVINDKKYWFPAWEDTSV